MIVIEMVGSNFFPSVWLSLNNSYVHGLVMGPVGINSESFLPSRIVAFKLLAMTSMTQSLSFLLCHVHT